MDGALAVSKIISCISAVLWAKLHIEKGIPTPFMDSLQSQSRFSTQLSLTTLRFQTSRELPREKATVTRALDRLPMAIGVPRCKE